MSVQQFLTGARMKTPRRDFGPAFGNCLDIVELRASGSGKEWVRAQTGSRDSERTDPRRDPAYHNQILFAGSRR